MTDESAFLRGIRADPHDSALRLVYSDWLEERGDPRGEFLRLLSADDELADSPGSDAVRARLRELRPGLDPGWVALLRWGLLLDLVRDFQGGATHGWKQELASLFNALPVYSDLGGALLLRPDGEVLEVGWDGVLVRPDGEVAEVVADVRPASGRSELIGLAAAAVTFPGLWPLAPPAPPGARACPACGGAGREPGPLTEDSVVSFCRRCCALGWVEDRPA